MKKISIIIALIITFFIIYFLQVNIFSTFTIAGVKPNLFIMYVLFIGLFANQAVRNIIWSYMWFDYRFNLPIILLI